MSNGAVDEVVENSGSNLNQSMKKSQAALEPSSQLNLKKPALENSSLVSIRESSGTLI